MFELTDLLLNFSANMGYLGIILLMTIESSFVPFPSEVVIPPAAYLAFQGEMNIFFVVLTGIAGSLIGATINYFLALVLGRKVVYSLASHRFAKFILIDEYKVKKAENYFLKYGNVSTFIGRLVPAVRQLISIPAGFSKMDFKNFIFFTFLGSSAWIVILASLGYFFGANQEILENYYGEIKFIFILLASVITLFFILKSFKLFNGKRK